MKSFREGGAERAARLESSHLCPSRYQYHIDCQWRFVTRCLSTYTWCVLFVCVWCHFLWVSFFFFHSLFHSNQRAALDFKLRRHPSQLVFFLSVTSFFQSRREVPIYLDSIVDALLNIQDITQQNCCLKKVLVKTCKLPQHILHWFWVSFVYSKHGNVC